MNVLIRPETSDVNRKGVGTGMKSLMRVGLVLLVLVVGFTAQAWAACPAGSIDLSNAANYNTDLNGDGTNEIAAPAADGGAATIQQSGDYCIPNSGITVANNLGGATVVVGGNGVGGWIVNANNVRIFGESPSATVSIGTGIVAAVQFIITVSAGLTGVEISNFTIATTTGGVNRGAITTAATVIQNMTFNDASGNPFATAVVQIQGSSTGAQVLNNTFNIANSSVPAIQIQGGSNHQIVGNTVNSGGGGATHGVQITGAVSNLNVSNNTFNTMQGDCVNAGAAVTNSQFNNNACNAPTGNGFNFTTTANNVTVEGNRITNAGAGGIRDAGGSNNQYVKNTINGAAGGDGIRFASSNNTVAGNIISNVSGGSGINEAGGAGNNTIGGQGNTITNVTGGDGITLSSAGNSRVLDNTINSVSGAGNDGINITTGGNYEIRNNTVSNVGAGNGLQDGSAGNNIIDRNTFMNITSVTPGQGTAITVGSNNNQITNNTIENTGLSAIRDVAVVANNTISGNTIRNAASGANPTVAAARAAAIRLANASTNNQILNNTIQDFGSSTYCVGISIDGGGANNNTIQGNEITNSKSCSGTNTGILAASGTNNTYENNNVHNTGFLQVGIEIGTSGITTVRGNTVSGMLQKGIVLRGGTTSNPVTVEGNTLENNPVGFSLEGGAANIRNCNIVDGAASLVAVDILAGVNAANFKVNGNSFRQAGIFYRNQGIGQLDATGNFHGAALTPGTNVIGNVDTSGALTSDTCPGATTPGSTTQADLSVSVTPAAPTVNAGDPTSATVTVSNAGPDAASNVQLTVNVGGGATAVSTPTPGCTASGNTVTCTIPTLAAGGNFTATVNFTAPGAAGTVTVDANATSSTTDPNAANNSASASVTVQQPTVGADVTTLVNRKIATGRLCMNITVLRNARGGATGDVTIQTVDLTGPGWTGGAQVMRGPGQLLRDGGVAVVLVRDLGCTTTNPADLDIELEFSNGTVLTADLTQAPTVEAKPLSVELRGGLLQVRAQDARSVRAEVFSLNGQKVLEAQGFGGRLAALALDRDGRPLANGVYLVAVTVEKLDGTVTREIRKVVVLR